MIEKIAQNKRFYFYYSCIGLIYITLQCEKKKVIILNPNPKMSLHSKPWTLNMIELKYQIQKKYLKNNIDYYITPSDDKCQT